MKNILLFVFLMLSASFGFSQNGKNFGEVSLGVFETDIDYNLYSCVKDSSNTVAQCNCYKSASVQWTTEIEKYNKIILSHLQNKAKEDFENSIKNWEAFKNAELESAYNIYRDVISDRIGIYRYHEKMVQLTRNRAFELKQYCIDMGFISY